MPWLEYTCSACGDQVFAKEIPKNHICHICINKKIQFTCSECGKVINVKVAPPSGLCGACQGKHLRSALKKGKKNILQAKKKKRKKSEDAAPATPIHCVDSSGNDIKFSELSFDCKHEDVMKDSSGEMFCKICGLVLEDHVVFLNMLNDPRTILEKTIITQRTLSMKSIIKARHKGRASQSEIDKREMREQKRRDLEFSKELLRIHRAEKAIIRDHENLDKEEREHSPKVYRCNREHPGEVFCDVCVAWIPSETAIEHRRSHLPGHQVWGATKHVKKHQEHPFPHAGKCYCPHCQQWIPACIKHKHNRMHFPKARKPFKYMGTGRPHKKKHPRESKEKEQLQKDLIDLLTREGHQTRNQLVAKLGKPRTTLFDDLDELMQHGIVESFDLPNEKKRGRPFKVYAIAGSEEKPCRKQDQIKTYKPHPNEHPHCFFCKICEQWIPAATGKKAHSRVHYSNGRNCTPDITTEVLELLKSGPITLKDFKNEIKLKPSTIYRKLMDMVAQEQIIMYRAKNPSGKHDILYQFFALPSLERDE